MGHGCARVRVRVRVRVRYVVLTIDDHGVLRAHGDLRIRVGVRVKRDFFIT